MSLPATPPPVMPLGYQRGRMVFVSQLRHVMERPVMVDGGALSFLATKGRSGEWLDAHPLVALAAVIACVIVSGWLA